MNDIGMRNGTEPTEQLTSDQYDDPDLKDGSMSEDEREGMTSIPEDSRETTHGDGYEARQVRKLLDGFQYTASPAYRLLCARFGLLNMKSLRVVVLAAKDFLERAYGRQMPPLSRVSKRSVGLMFKYIHEHLEEMRPVFDEMTLWDNQGIELYKKVPVKQRPFPYCSIFRTVDFHGVSGWPKSVIEEYMEKL